MRATLAMAGENLLEEELKPGEIRTECPHCGELVLVRKDDEADRGNFLIKLGQFFRIERHQCPNGAEPCPGSNTHPNL
jgi:hypothetical protein